MFSPALDVARALDDLAAEPVDFVGRHVAEILVERLAGFELLAVDQQRARPRQPVAVFVIIPEQLETAVYRRSWCRRRSRGRKPEM